MAVASIIAALALLLAGVAARTIDTNHVDEDTARATTDGGSFSFLPDFRSMYKVYSECSSQDLSSCLKLKLVTALDRASRSLADLKISEDVSFVRDPSAPIPREEPKSEQELEAQLPRALSDKEDSLDGMILDRIMSFMKTHTLQLKFPSAEDLQRSLTEEGRKKKMSGLILLPIMMAGMMIPIALGGLALLAGKALLVSKLALVLSAVIGLKKLLSGSGGHDSSYQVVSIPSSGHHYGRNLQEAEDSHQLAYRAYAPTPNTSS